MTIHFTAFDTHCSFTDVAVVTTSGRQTKRLHCETRIPALIEVLQGVPRPRRLTFEEGPLADWLYRNLKPYVDELVVCEPRRNRLISEEGEKDDPLDAGKLAQLYRGGYLKEVHHPESLERSILKQHVALYHDRVRQRVREANRIIGFIRHHGVSVTEDAFTRPEDRTLLLGQLPTSELLHKDLELLLRGYDVSIQQETEMHERVTLQAKQHEVVRRFADLPGYGWIRSVTFFVYVDSPGRFPSKESLWKYCGIGLERRHSGKGPMQLHVSQNANRRLKSTVLGGAKTAIQHGENRFADLYRRWVQEGGISLPNARRNVARSQVATLWGMWKNGSAYHPDWVASGTTARPVRRSSS
jgi:transposase